MPTLAERLKTIESKISTTPLSNFFVDKSNVPKFIAPISRSTIEKQAAKQQGFNTVRQKTLQERVGELAASIPQYVARDLTSFALDIVNKSQLPEPKTRLGLTLRERLFGLNTAEGEQLKSAYSIISERAKLGIKLTDTENKSALSQLPSYSVAALSLGGQVLLDTYLGGGKGKVAKDLVEESVRKIGKEQTELLLKSGGEQVLKDELEKISEKKIGSSVLQIVDKQTNKVEFKVIPKNELENFKSLIDSTDRGIAGTPIDNKIYHLTAKTPEAMTKTGAKYTGIADAREIESIISKTESSLLQEAKKYKSADEFVKAQPKLYHGGTADIKEINLNKTKFSKTFYLSDDANYAKSFGGNRSVVNEMVLDPKANIIDLRKPNDKQIQTIIDAINVEKAKPTKYGESFSFNPFSDKQVIKGIKDGKAHFIELPEIKKILKDLGYDGMITSEVPYAKNIGIFNPKVIKTKYQLIDIWNKANKKVSIGKLDTKYIQSKIGQDLRLVETKNSLEKLSKGLVDGLPEKARFDVVSSYTDNLTQGDKSVNKIIDALTEAKPLRKQQETIYTKERGKRLAGALNVRQNIKGEAGFFAEKAQLKGEIKKVEFESIRNKLSQGDIDNLFTKLTDSPLISDWEKFSARVGLSKLLGEAGGKVPTKGEINLLNKVFGEDFTKAVLNKRTFWEKLAEGVYQTLNVPRSIMASFDLSAPFRQGIFLIGKPKRFLQSFVKMFKTFGSEKAFKVLMSEIDARPTRQLMSDSGLSLTSLGTNLTDREEVFMSNWAEKIPVLKYGIRASERAYVGFLNKLRADVFDDFIVKAANVGLDLNADRDLAKGVAKFVNAATGRGSLGSLENAAVQLNSTFFSPRLMSSRLTLLNPIYYIKQEPFVRKEALKSLLSFAGVMASVIGLISLNDNVSVQKDPRSADFAKIKIGNTRIDVLGGFQQYIRIAAQLISGKIVSSTTGKTMLLGEGYRPLTRYEIILRSLEYKTAPVASFIVGLFKGSNAIGEDFKITTEVKNRFTPMVAQDIMDLQKDNPDLLPLGTAAVFGFGLQTYAERTIDDIKKEIKQEYDEGKLTREAAAIKYENELKKFQRREKTLRFEMPEDQYKLELKNLYQSDSMTREEAETEFKEYKEAQILKQKEQKDILDSLTGNQSDDSFIGKVILYAKAIGTDPITAFNRIITGQKIRRIDNGAIIVKRLPVEESQAIKSNLGATSDLMLDHTTPLELGGSNSEKNLKLVPRDVWESYTPVENYLGRQLRDGKITKKEAQDLIIKFKNGEIKASDIIK